MRKTNLAIKASVTTGEVSELYPSNQNLAEPYIGGSIIRRLVRKTQEGKKIEDCLNEDTDTTASARESLSEVDIMPKKDFTFTATIPTSHSLILKKWHGYIEKIDGQEFTAILTDPLGTDSDIRATFSINEVSEGDRDLVVENALFDWVISRDRKSHGQIENKDFLIFKRLPMWKKSDLNTKSAKVDKLNAWLNSGSTL